MIDWVVLFCVLLCFWWLLVICFFKGSESDKRFRDLVKKEWKNQMKIGEEEGGGIQ